MEVSCTPWEEKEKEESGDKEWPDEEHGHANQQHEMNISKKNCKHVFNWIIGNTLVNMYVYDYCKITAVWFSYP